MCLPYPVASFDGSLNAMITLLETMPKDRLVVAHVSYGLRALTEDENARYRFVSFIKFQSRQSIGEAAHEKQVKTRCVP